jgi:hypothetical protein
MTGQYRFNQINLTARIRMPASGIYRTQQQAGLETFEQ